ncbi:hypothetical protein P389DRAFT_208096, partial [Cystobasidium minutum MCA 4210]|uniref:uncharacterized protein n=1 Tax=Cystobasidium minutum MCA 4210 TaxID=1397322 RepID=UPI0034CD3762|eukprot:jgi/Rhomi1/208096/estExt_Genemark1.C_1_t30108
MKGSEPASRISTFLSATISAFAFFRRYTSMRMFEKKNKAMSESKAFLLKPLGLQELSRRTVFVKQRLREKMPVNTLHLPEAQTSKQELDERL